jgi:hypothetical protein
MSPLFEFIMFVIVLFGLGSLGERLLVIDDKLTKLLSLTRAAELPLERVTPIRGAVKYCPHGFRYDELCEPCGRTPDPSPRSNRSAGN